MTEQNKYRMGALAFIPKNSGLEPVLIQGAPNPERIKVQRPGADSVFMVLVENLVMVPECWAIGSDVLFLYGYGNEQLRGIIKDRGPSGKPDKALRLTVQVPERPEREQYHIHCDPYLPLDFLVAHSMRDASSHIQRPDKPALEEEAPAEEAPQLKVGDFITWESEVGKRVYADRICAIEITNVRTSHWGTTTLEHLGYRNLKILPHRSVEGLGLYKGDKVSWIRQGQLREGTVLYTDHHGVEVSSAAGSQLYINRRDWKTYYLHKIEDTPETPEKEVEEPHDSKPPEAKANPKGYKFGVSLKDARRAINGYLPVDVKLHPAKAPEAEYYVYKRITKTVQFQFEDGRTYEIPPPDPRMWKPSSPPTLYAQWPGTYVIDYGLPLQQVSSKRAKSVASLVYKNPAELGAVLSVEHLEGCMALHDMGDRLVCCNAKLLKTTLHVAHCLVKEPPPERYGE